MSPYDALRAWSFSLFVVGIVSGCAALLAVVLWAIDASGAWETLAVVVAGTPVVLLACAVPLALSQVLRALADVGDTISVDPLSHVPSSHL